MASILRRGRIPVPPTGISEYIDQVFTIRGFFGPWAHLYRKHNTAHVTSASRPDLIYQGLDASTLVPSDAEDPEGAPLVLLTGPKNSVAISGRRHAAPFAERNVDRHQIRFYHQGRYVLETEFGPLDVGPGDFVVLPANVAYRELPVDPGSAGSILILESEHHISLSEQLWDKVGFAGVFIDYSAMELATPEERDADTPTRVRLWVDGRYEWIEHAFDPTRDVIGWLGDPIVFKMNVWDIPGIGTTHNFLTPPANAVLYADDYSCFFNVLGPRPAVTTPPPNGSVGAPAHHNLGPHRSWVLSWGCLDASQVGVVTHTPSKEGGVRDNYRCVFGVFGCVLGVYGVAVLAFLGRGRCRKGASCHGVVTLLIR